MNVGIIGGADGPTAIYITSAAGKWIIAGAAAIILFGIIFFIGLRKRGK